MANIFVHFEVITDENNDQLPYVAYDRLSQTEDYQKIMKEYNDHWGAKKDVGVPFHNWAGNGKVEELRSYVAQNGASWLIDARDEQGWTPLHEAARNGHIETISYLLEIGADINALTHPGATATYIAEYNQGADSLVVRYLESRGGIRREPVQISPTLPHSLAGDGQLDRLRELADAVNPRYLHVQDSNGWTPLHEASRMGHAEVVKYLLEEGAALNAQTNDGGTPLYYAAQFQGTDSLVYHMLKEFGGLQLGPEL